jgi:hypothetical protein
MTSWDSRARAVEEFSDRPSRFADWAEWLDDLVHPAALDSLLSEQEPVRPREAPTRPSSAPSHR